MLKGDTALANMFRNAVGASSDEDGRARSAASPATQGPR
jgi:hypothetical protein